MSYIVVDFKYLLLKHQDYIILDSIVVSIPACHAGDRGSIPRRGDFCFFISFLYIGTRILIYF